MASKVPSAGEGKTFVWAEIRKLAVAYRAVIAVCNCSDEAMWRNEAEFCIVFLE
jgi:hypothetical protein